LPELKGEESERVEPDDLLSYDTLFAGRLHCLQHRNGYRFSVDAILAAHFSPLSAGSKVLDLGCGCGVIGLICLYRWPEHIAHLACLELQAGLAELAARNMVVNGFAAESFRVISSGIVDGDTNESKPSFKNNSCLFSFTDGIRGRKEIDKSISYFLTAPNVKVVQGDLRHILDFFPAETFSHVICNPPFYKKNSGRPCHDEESSIARHQVHCTLAEVVASAAAVVKNRGKVVFVYPATGLPALLSALHFHHLVPKRLQLVYSYPDASAPARLVLVEAIKNGGEGVRILSPFYIYEQRSGAYSQEMQQLYEG
jgi:tRNA1Val (adenine37-N6)-methyltransferase